LVSHMDYYTGIVFEGYNGKLGFPLVSGGRYDELLGTFHRPAPARGFGIFFDRLIEAVGAQQAAPPCCCVMYTNERRKDALAFAEAKRNEGKVVVLQEYSAVSDVAAFTSRFSEVVTYMDERERGDDR